MTVLRLNAIIAIEFEPEANTSIALRALRHSGVLIKWLDVSEKDAVAGVEVADLEALNATVEAICSCSGVRSGVALPSEA